MIPNAVPPKRGVYDRPAPGPRNRRALWLAVPVIVVLIAAGLLVQQQSGPRTGPGPAPPNVPPGPDLNRTDTDSDGLSDHAELRIWGTNISNPDTDGDGMGDWWEAHFGKRDNRTMEWNPDPNDPADAYDDPDNDGYDFNHNGYLDGSELDPDYAGFDRVVKTGMKLPGNAKYTTYTLNQLLSNHKMHNGELVRVAGALVVDNGSYAEGTGRMIHRWISINITDPSTNMQLPVLLEARSNRPPDLNDRAGLTIPADVVDVQGIFEGSGLDWRITVRGTEKFTNLMEYLSARDYDDDGSMNWTDPNSWDTDGDWMSDAWEVHCGPGFINTSLSPPKWDWLVQMDPTWPGDSAGEGSPFTDIDQDRIQVPDPSSGNLKWVGYNRDEYLTVLDNDLLSMLPRSRLNLADLLGRPDISRTLYAYGTDPAAPDTDRDSFDSDGDGRHTRDVDTNANDFNEILFMHADPLNPDTDNDTMWDGWESHFGLNATNAQDRELDPDNDLLANYLEFRHRTSPRRWDTDDEGLPCRNPHAIFDDPNDPRCFDGMPDGWELKYGLDPLDKSDAGADIDVKSIDGLDVASPDGLANLAEYQNGTDPKNPDTDDDTMPDGWEVKYGLNATDPSDRLGDPDGDRLVNYLEFEHRTNPRRWDTDDEGAARWDNDALADDPDDPACFDGMPDGWEVKYGLDPLDPDDAATDIDVIRIGGTPVHRPDGLLNLEEYYNGTDPTNPDTDGDHLSDYEEIVIGWEVVVDGVTGHYHTCATAVDTDEDTAQAPLLPSGELPGPAGSEFLQPNGTGTKNDLNDWNEVSYHRTNASDPDTDGDGLSDGVELFTDRDPQAAGLQATDPCLTDTDGDVLPDGVEVVGLFIYIWSEDYRQVWPCPVNPDSDYDGLSDGYEVLHAFAVVDPSGKAQEGIGLFRDADGFWYPASAPVNASGRPLSLNPVWPDTDGDGLPDGYEFNHSDPDCDSLPSGWELSYGKGKLDPWRQDTDGDGTADTAEDLDGDGLDNLEEYRYRADPFDSSSPEQGEYTGDSRLDKAGHPVLRRPPIYSDGDFDRMPDWWELRYGLDPAANESWEDLDSDGFANLDEYIYGTDPGHPDADGDFRNDWEDHPFTYNKHSVDRDENGIADWWEKFYFGGPCDPNGNPDGPWDPSNGRYGDNWTNLQEWRNSPAGSPDFLFRTSPIWNDTDWDGVNDDFDKYPRAIPFIDVPMNPTELTAPMDPLSRVSATADLDNDGLTDIEEHRYKKGTLDPSDPDCDQDGMPDGWEVRYGLDPLDPSDALEDPDNDGVNYSLKWVDYNFNHWPDPGEFIITEYDANRDGLIDPFCENESFCNAEEYWFGQDPDADGVNELTPDPSKSDSDGDTMIDGYEYLMTDSDGDGMPSIWELRWGLNPLDPRGANGSAGDPDGDGSTNGQEYSAHTDPLDPLSHP